MADIAARIPYYVTNSADISLDLYVEVRIYNQGASVPTDPQYTIKKQRYNEISELLRVDISPFLRDYFSAVPSNPISTGKDAISSGEYLKAEIKVNSVTETYDVFDGYIEFPVSTVASIDSVKNVSEDSKQFITANLAGMVEIKWSSDNGNTDTLSYTANGTNDYIEIPVLSSGLDYTGSGDVTVEAYNTGNSTPNFIRTYKYVCVYDKVYTISYVNRYGAWETFDCVGKKEDSFSADGDDYVSFEEGNTKVFGKNSKTSFNINTGWVDDNFAQVIQDLLLSESVYIYEDDTVIEVILKSKSASKLVNPNVQMKNYRLKFEEAKNKIDIV